MYTAYNEHTRGGSCLIIGPAGVWKHGRTMAGCAMQVEESDASVREVQGQAVQLGDRVSKLQTLLLVRVAC